MKQQGSSGEYHRADPGRRRHMLWLLAATVLLALAGFAGLQAWLAMPHGNVEARAHAIAQALGILCLLFAGIGAVFALWLFRLASATHAERRWPPSSMRTSSDVKIRYLTSADALVTQMKGGAIALALLALALAGWGAWLLRRG